MLPNLLESIGELNPQLMRELKGRLKLRNVLIVVVVSIAVQFWRFESIYRRLSFNMCRADGSRYRADQCFGEWLFDDLLAISILILLVGGTFLLIRDLCQEERRGTLNFIRLSPHSEKSIILGKMLGVPVLLYLLVIVAVPLHLWAGIAAAIPLGKILLVYTIIIASCILFYSAALLCSLIVCRRSRLMSWLGWLMPWLGSGAVLALSFVVLYPPWEFIDYPLAWLTLFHPFDPIFYLLQYNGHEYYFPNSFQGPFWSPELGWNWYYLPVGASGLTFTGFVLLNYGLWSYWIGQGIKRCFRNSKATILSKRQSYLLMVCLELLILGLFVREEQRYNPHFYSEPDLFKHVYSASEQLFFASNWASEQLFYLAFLNAVLVFGLIAILSPSRQVLQDWGRYRREKFSDFRDFSKNTLVQDLIWGDKSPAVVAIAINIAIATIPLVIWSLFGPFNNQQKTQAFVNIALFFSLMMIYGTIAQLMLMMKTKKRVLLAIGTVVAAVFSTHVMLAMLGLKSDNHYILGLFGLFSTFPWANIENAAMKTLFLAFLGLWTFLALLNLQLIRQLRHVGESTSKCSQ
ncbi:MAG: ABC transporter permease [Symploca sp. SIO3C6]|nr:ABC transporter permease [Symploca sp. SIO3C6]